MPTVGLSILLGIDQHRLEGYKRLPKVGQSPTGQVRAAKDWILWEQDTALTSCLDFTSKEE